MKKTTSAKPRVVLGVTASIAAFRAAELASLLTKEGIDVDVVMTRDSLRFITPLTFSALTHRPVVTDENEGMIDGRPAHIALADDADLVVVAPATANLLAQYACGLAPEALTCVLLATLAPVLVAPAMNGKMWQHAATQANVSVLKKRGVKFIGPDNGLLACGYEGLGRLWPVADIGAKIISELRVLRGRK